MADTPNWDDTSDVEPSWESTSDVAVADQPYDSPGVPSDLAPREAKRLDLLSQMAAEKEEERKIDKQLRGFDFIEGGLVSPQTMESAIRMGTAPGVADLLPGATRSVAKTASSLTSPLNLSLLGVGGGAAQIPKYGAAAVRGIAGGFAADMARHIPESAQAAGEASVTGTPEQRQESYTDLATQMLMTGAAGRGAIGDVRPSVPVPPRITEAQVSIPRIEPPIEIQATVARDVANAEAAGLTRSAKALREKMDSAKDVEPTFESTKPVEPISTPEVAPVTDTPAQVANPVVEFSNQVKSTENAWDFGRTRQTPEGIAELEAIQSQIGQQLEAIKADPAMAPMDKLNARAAIVSGPSHFIKEAISAAKNEQNRPAMTEYLSKVSEPTQPVRVAEAAPETTMPKSGTDISASPETVRLYRGQDATGQAAGGEFWSSDPAYARAFGENMQYVDVPKAVADTARAEFQRTGSGTPNAHILEGEWTKQAKPLETPVEPKVADLTPEVTPPPSFARETLATPRSQTTGVTPSNIQIEVGNVFDKAKPVLRKWLTAKGNLPGETFASKERMGGQIQRAEKDIKFMSRDLKDALAEHYGIGTIQRAGGALQRIPADVVRYMDGYLKGENDGATIPAPIKGKLDNMRAAIDDVSSRIITELEARGGSEQLVESIRNNLDVYVARSYKFFDSKSPAPKWYEELPPLVKQRAEQFVRNSDPSLTPDQAQAKLLNWLSDLKANEGGLGGKTLGSKDLSQFIKRKQIAPEIRAVLGEYNDPLINFARTLTKGSDFLAKQEFLGKAREQGMGKWLFEEADAPPGFNTKIAAEGSEALSPLNGLRTSPEIAEAFNVMGKQGDPSAIAKAYYIVNALTKQAATVQSVLTQVRNLTSQPAFFGMSGHWKLGELGKTTKAIAEDLGVTRNTPEFREYLKEAAEYGIVNDTVRAGEMRDIVKDAALNDAMPDSLSQFSTAKLVKNAYFKLPQELYKISDELGKIYGWENEKAIVRKVHPDWTEAQVKAEAATRVRNQYPTYSKIPAALKEIRKVPLIGPFMSFPYEVMRTSYHAIGQSLKELRSSNPVEKKVGARRLASQMATVAFPATLAAVSKAMFGISNEQENDLRRFQPSWSKNSQYLYTGKDDNGKISYLNLSYQNPYSYLIDPVLAVAGSIQSDEPFLDASARAVGEFVRPFVSEQILANALLEARNNKTETGRQIYNPQDDPGVKAAKISDHIFSTMVPGTINRARNRIIPSITGQQPPYGRVLKPVTEIAAELTGQRLEQFDFKNGLAFKGKQFRRDLTDAEGIFRNEAFTRGNTSPESLLEAYQTAQEQRYKLWQEMRKDYLAAMRNGVGATEAKNALTDMGLGVALTKSVANGTYDPWFPSPESMSKIEQSGRVIPKAQMREILQQYRGKGLE